MKWRKGKVGTATGRTSCLRIAEKENENQKSFCAARHCIGMHLLFPLQVAQSKADIEAVRDEIEKTAVEKDNIIAAKDEEIRYTSTRRSTVFDFPVLSVSLSTSYMICYAQPSPRHKRDRTSGGRATSFAAF